MARKYKQGHYQVKNTKKYVGTNTNPRYLSSLELETFKWCDRSPDVLAWGAEIVVVPYFDPMRQKKRRYIVDVYIKYVDKNGVVRQDLVEIKPSSEATKPRRGKKRIDVYERQMVTWHTNQAKWQAAAKYAHERGMNFRVITQKAITGKKR